MEELVETDGESYKKPDNLEDECASWGDSAWVSTGVA